MSYISLRNPLAAATRTGTETVYPDKMLIFSLGRPDVLPVDAPGFLEGVHEAYGLEARPTAKELRERGEIWRPYRTFATWYMWGVRRLALGIANRERTRIVSL